MHTYTLLFRDPGGGRAMHALSFAAPSAQQAVMQVRNLPIRDRCELWTDGCYVCSLTVRGGRKGWCIVALDEPAAEVDQVESRAGE